MIDRTWLEARMDDVPASLRTRMSDTLRPRTGGELTPYTLKAAAEELLSEVISQGAGADPNDLLAADALVTLACEALSQFEPEALVDFK